MVLTVVVQLLVPRLSGLSSHILTTKLNKVVTQFGERTVRQKTLSGETASQEARMERGATQEARRVSKAVARTTTCLPLATGGTTPTGTRRGRVERGSQARATARVTTGVAHSLTRLKTPTAPVTSMRLRQAAN